MAKALFPSSRNAGGLDDPPPDEALVARYLEGDISAFAVLLSRYEQPVFRFICRYVNDHQRAEDIYQETFVRVVRGASQFQPGTTFAAWLFRIARNLCIDAIRRAGVRKVVSLDGPSDGSARPDGKKDALGDLVPDHEPGPDARVIDDEQSRLVREAVDRLPEDLRELVLLKEIAGLTFREIAAMTGTPESTLKSRMQSALDQLRQLLSRHRLARS